MAIDHVDDHAEAAVLRMTEALHSSATLNLLVRANAAGIQQVEDAFQQILTLRWIDTASGAQLDMLGRTVGQDRGGRTDDVYRIWLRARVRLNRTRGTPEDLISVFSAIVGGNATVLLDEQFPAGLALKIGPGATFDPVEGAELLRMAKAAGVNAILETIATDDPTAFAFDPNGAGFGDATDPNVGGIWAEAF